MRRVIGTTEVVPCYKAFAIGGGALAGGLLRMVQKLAGEDFLDRGGLAIGVEVEVEDLLPHGGEVDEVALLAGVLLGDLDFHGLPGLRETGEERRDGLAGLEVDGAFLNLEHDIRAKATIQRREDVVGGAGAVGFGVAPVEVRSEERRVG